MTFSDILCHFDVRARAWIEPDTLAATAGGRGEGRHRIYSVLIYICKGLRLRPLAYARQAARVYWLWGDRARLPASQALLESKMESPKSRAVFTVVAGLACGVFIGIFPLALWAALSIPGFRFMFEDEPWTELPLEFAVCAVAAGINGVVGAVDGLRSRRHKFFPVILAPLALPIWPAVEYVLYPRNSDKWGYPMFWVTFFLGFVWFAGRLGQRIGIAGSRPSIRGPETRTRRFLTGRQRLAVWGLTFLIGIDCLGLWCFVPANARSFDTFRKFDDYMWSKGEWIVAIRPRATWTPGTVFEVTEKVLGEKGETIKGEVLNRFLSDERARLALEKRQVAKSRFPKLRAPAVGSELKHKFGMLPSGGDRSPNLIVDLGETQIHSIPLVDLQGSLSNMVGTAAESKQLFVITDVLVSSQVQVRLLWDEPTGIRKDEVDAQFAPFAHINSKGHLVVEGPLVVAYKAMRLEWIPSRQLVEFTRMDRFDQKRLGEIRPFEGLDR